MPTQRQLKFRNELNKKFRLFADRQKVDDDYRAHGIQLCEKVRHFLEQQNGVSIAATFYGGSIGKHIEVASAKPDFDMIMKVNDYQPPFKIVIEFWKRCLRNAAHQLDIIQSSITSTQVSITFSFKNGMQVDLLPAVANMTAQQAMQKIELDPIRMGTFYSSSLVEQQVNFMKQQDAFTHAVTRLSKSWYKSMDFGDYGNYIYGGSLIFELLSVAAVLEVRKGDTSPEVETILNAFIRVIEKVLILDRLRLAFKRTANGWVKSRASGQTIPYLVEPSNRFNNLLRAMKPIVMKMLVENARVMKARIKFLKKELEYCLWREDDDILDVNFEKLFQTVTFKIRLE